MQRPRQATSETTGSVAPSRLRADGLGDLAEAARRAADTLLDEAAARHRLLAGAAGVAGLAGVGLAAALAAGIGNPPVVALAAVLTVLAPTAFCLIQCGDGEAFAREAAIDRGLCQALAVQARRLGEAVDATDERRVPLSADALVNTQIDGLYRDLDKARQRLGAAGADLGRAAAPSPRDRIVPEQTETVVTDARGRRHRASIVALSMTGVTLRGALPPLGTADIVRIGTRQGRVAEAGPQRATFTFLTPIGAGEFTRRILL